MINEKALQRAAVALSGAPFPSKASLRKAEAAITAYLAALSNHIPATGQMVLVPREPTEAMMDAAIAVTENPCFPQDIYRAMIDAAGGRDE